MGLSIALGGGIASIAIITMFTIFGSAITQIYELNSSRTESTHLEGKIIQTDIDMHSLVSQPAGNIGFTLENTGNEKLWDYNKFHVLVTYDANIGGVSTPTTEMLQYNSAQAFAQLGSSGSPQFARPDEDVLKGGWTDVAGGDGDGALYDEVDESTRNDADFARSATLTILGQTDTWVMGLTSVEDPQTSSNHIVRYVYKKDGGAVNVRLTVRLLEGGTQIASWTHTNIGTSSTLATQTLSAGEANSITNYSNLRLEFTADYLGGILPGSAADVSWVEFQVPGVSGIYDCTVTSISAGQWTIDRISGDLSDPRILNTGEDGKICIRLSNSVFANTEIGAVISTDIGKTDSETTTS